jgi:intracellular sulfur oxidation DsrE/DsrF family protein
MPEDLASTDVLDASAAAPTLPTSRRDFLGSAGAGVAALAAVALPSWPTGGIPGLGAPAYASGRVAAPWSDAWLDKITGKHKQFFDGVSWNDGFVLAFAKNFLDLNHEAYGLTDKDLTAVVGLRHFAMPMALPDALWERYKIGDAFKVIDPATKAPAVRNPAMHADGLKLPPGCDIPTLVGRGVVFTVCNVALTVISGMLATNAGVTADAAKQEWTQQLLPGMTLVPVGVLAVNRAQEKGCTYCYGG